MISKWKFFLQALKPVYELFLERRVQEVTSQAVSAATGISRENVDSAMGLSRQNSAATPSAKKRHVANGKAKDLWEHANANNDSDPPSNGGLFSAFVEVFKNSTDKNATHSCNTSKPGPSGKRRKSRRKV